MVNPFYRGRKLFFLFPFLATYDVLVGSPVAAVASTGHQLLQRWSHRKCLWTFCLGAKRLNRKNISSSPSYNRLICYNKATNKLKTRTVILILWGIIRFKPNHKVLYRNTRLILSVKCCKNAVLYCVCNVIAMMPGYCWRLSFRGEYPRKALVVSHRTVWEQKK